jgi:predicted GNAT family N-acyltransferase
VHFLALEGDFPIGTARLLPDGTIGRVSVLKDWRGLKVGDALMQAVIGSAEPRPEAADAQRPGHATAFYERLGFRGQRGIPRSRYPACRHGARFALNHLS